MYELKIEYNFMFEDNERSMSSPTLYGVGDVNDRLSSVKNHKHTPTYTILLIPSPAGVCDPATLTKLLEDVRKLKQLEEEVRMLKMEMATSIQSPNDSPQSSPNEPKQTYLPSGSSKETADDLMWYSMHIAAAGITFLFTLIFDFFGFLSF